MADLPQVLKALPQSNDPWRDWEWLHNPDERLKNKTPLSYIRRGDASKVLQVLEQERRATQVAAAGTPADTDSVQ